MRPTRPKNVLLLCPMPIGEHISGPTMRYYHFYMELKKHHHVQMLIPEYKEDLDPHWHSLNKRSLKTMGRWADVIVVQGTMMFHYPQLKRFNKPLVIDLYDPFILENLEYRNSEFTDKMLYDIDLSILKEQLKHGDYYICSNVRQADFWIGCLSITGKISVGTYHQMQRPSDVIGIVPMGIPIEAPRLSHSIRESVGIGQDDFVVIWAGGIWKWLDIETLLQAFVLLKEREPLIKLLIMGGNSNDELKKACEREGLLGQNVVLTDWVPYQERHQFLLSADVGVITHFDNLETRYSHRTRVLDHMWCDLPTISTCGDYLSDWLSSNGAGLQCKFKDPADLVSRIVALYENPIERSAMISRIQQLKPALYWESNLEPLIDYCNNPVRIEKERGVIGRIMLKPAFRMAKRSYPFVKQLRRRFIRKGKLQD